MRIEYYSWVFKSYCCYTWPNGLKIVPCIVPMALPLGRIRSSRFTDRIRISSLTNFKGFKSLWIQSFSFRLLCKRYARGSKSGKNSNIWGYFCNVLINRSPQLSDEQYIFFIDLFNESDAGNAGVPVRQTKSRGSRDRLFRYTPSWASNKYPWTPRL